MTELETRLREGLQADPDAVDADHFLAGVRRGVGWRHARRATVGVAVAVAALIGGSVLLQAHRDVVPAPMPVTQTTPTTAQSSTATTTTTGRDGRVLDLAAGGDHVLQLTTHDGCRRCSVIRELTEAGDWQRSGVIPGGSRALGTAQHLYLAPDGLDGWADGRLLWVTHDGGQTWQWVDRGPGLRPGAARLIGVGTQTAWAAVIDPQGVSLWRTDIGSDTWQRVTGVPRLADFTTFAGVTDDDRVAFVASGEAGSASTLVLGRPGDWTSVPMGFGVDALVRTDGTTFWTSIPEPQGLRMFRLVDGQWQDLGRFVAQNWWPMDAQRVLLDRSPAGVFTDHGIQPTDLRAGTRILALSHAPDGTFWALGTGGRVATSTDGLHWTAHR
jgi:hypothetical protein